MSRKSATVLALADYRTKHRTLYFTRHELNQLLSVYSRHVARGVWRDYAIDHRDGMALFSVFRHTHEAPAYSIVKTAPVQTRASDLDVHGPSRRFGHRQGSVLEPAWMKGPEGPGGPLLSGRTGTIGRSARDH